MSTGRWVTFDLNGTLLDPSALERAAEPVLPSGFGVGVLDDAILQAMADSLAGAYRPFPAYLGAAVKRRLALLDRAGDAAEEVIAAAARMPAFGETASALELLRGAGYRLAVLTNSARADGERSLREAGVREYIEQVMGSDEVRLYKPATGLYEHALNRLGTRPSDAWMVAAHGWDLLGARRAGMRWVARKERVLLDTVPEPDASGADLLEVAEHIAASG